MVDNLSFLTNSEKNEYKILEDKFINANNKSTYVETDFIDPFWQSMVSSLLNLFGELSVSFLGGKNDAERKRCVIYKSFLKEPDPYDYIAILTFKNYAGDIRHKDILGKLMSLGIKREAIGDIFVGNEACYFVVKKSIENFLIAEFTDIRRHKIHLESAQVEDIQSYANEFNRGTIVVPSLRADALTSKVYNVGRKLASDLISNGMLKVDYRFFLRPDKKIDIPCLLSLRGYGRVYLDEIEGYTQKDNCKINIRRMIDR